jgi:hypothetical protein
MAPFSDFSSSGLLFPFLACCLLDFCSPLFCSPPSFLHPPPSSRIISTLHFRLLIHNLHCVFPLLSPPLLSSHLLSSHFLSSPSSLVFSFHFLSSTPLYSFINSAPSIPLLFYSLLSSPLYFRHHSIISYSLSPFIPRLTLRATSSELLTANALGSSSPKKRVKAVSTAVMSPRDTEGKYSVAVATKSAVLRGWGEG